MKETRFTHADNVDCKVPSHSVPQCYCAVCSLNGHNAIKLNLRGPVHGV